MTEALRRAHAATTPGEWSICTETRGDEICTIYGVPDQPTEEGIGQGWVYIHYQNVQDGEWHWAEPDEKLANAHFIALAHKEVPALIDRIEALEAALRKIASCEKRTDGDVVDIARTALGEPS